MLYSVLDLEKVNKLSLSTFWPIFKQKIPLPGEKTQLVSSNYLFSNKIPRYFD